MSPKKPVRDPAPAGMRDAIRQGAEQAWREPVAVVYLGRAARFRIKFTVPGLRGDGSVKGEHPWQRFFTKLPVWTVLFLAYLVSFVFMVLWFAIQFVIIAALNDQSTPESKLVRWQRRLEVKAESPQAGAVVACRALAGKRGHLWLVASSRGIAFTQSADGRQDVLWTGTVPAAPVYRPGDPYLTWPDGSTLQLALPKREYKVIARGLAS
ncbi:MAG TPA: hypothetical protein VFW65_30110 [Pseudonocardiaceae bacterium]|nr:hypothetical protein [Pseudonocardiaceae bacterium]